MCHANPNLSHLLEAQLCLVNIPYIIIAGCTQWKPVTAYGTSVLGICLLLDDTYLTGYLMLRHMATTVQKVHLGLHSRSVLAHVLPSCCLLARGWPLGIVVERDVLHRAAAFTGTKTMENKWTTPLEAGQSLW